MYLDELAAKIRKHIPEDRLPDGEVEELLRIYAVLLRAKGADVTSSDVHDAWSAWMAKRNNEHASLVPYEDLPGDVQNEDSLFARAVQLASDESRCSEESLTRIERVLFPSGPPKGDAAIKQTLELYKIMVDSSEGLVGRRQNVNTFFLTMNGALLTASGIIVQNSEGNRVSGLGVAVLAVAGGILCAAWRSLITSFGQLNRGKFKVINTIERFLEVSIYAAEWEALGRGEDPKTYRSFTSREIWVPNALLGLYIVTAIVGLLVAAGVVVLNGVALGK